MKNGLVEGVSLRDVLRVSGAMAPEAAATVLSGTLLTLAVRHGDVRPENVLVDASGGLTVTGFGGPDPEFTPEEPTYLAPERLAGGPPTQAADVFAATAVFFECLTGEPPFRAATPEDLTALHEYTQIIAEFAPPELRPLIHRGLTADPAARPADPHAFLAEADATATAAYGPDWQTRGRALLGGWATTVAASEGAELAEPDEMPEPPPVGEPIDERLLGLGEAEVESGSDELLNAFGAEDAVDEGGLGPADDLLSAFDELAPHSESGLGAEEFDDGGDAYEAAESAREAGLEPAAETAETVAESESGPEPAADADADAFTETGSGAEAESAADMAATETEPVSLTAETESAAEPAADAAADSFTETGPGAETESAGDMAVAESEPVSLTGTEISSATDSAAELTAVASATEPVSLTAAETESAAEPDSAAELAADSELAAETDPDSEPDSDPDSAPTPATTLLLDTAAEQTAEIGASAEPLVPPSVQADIDHDWEIPSKPVPVVPRSLSAYANSLPSLPRPGAAEVEPAEPVATSAPDDWFRPGVAEPVDRGPRPTRQTAFLDPDEESTAVAPAGFDGGFEEPEGGEEGADPGGPRRKTLVGAVTAAVLLVAGAAAVVLGGAGNSGPAPAAQSSSGSATPDSPTSTDSVPGTPSGTDDSSTAQTSSAAAPSSKHTTPHSSSKTTKPAGSTTTSSTHSSSPSPTDGSTSASSSATSSDSGSSSSPSSTPSTGGSTTPTHATSTPSGHHSSTTPSETPTS